MWLEEHALIRRSPSAVFDFMDDAEAQARVTPGVDRVRSVRRLPNGGMACELVYRLVGFELSESVEAVVYERPRYVEYAVRGPISAQLFGRYREVEEGTRVELAIAYDLPNLFDNALVRAFAHRFNRWALRSMIRAMTHELEAQGEEAPAQRRAS
jgi:carbon monoxide dehydrogenase subunit G